MTSKLSQVFQITEAPLDFKKSFGKAKKALAKSGVPGIAHGIEVPKGAKKPPEAKPIRGKEQPENDPLKTTTNSEVFETDHGMYVVFKGVNGQYYSLFIDADMENVQDLGQHAGRKQAIDDVLAHHDKQAAGIGESVDEDDEVDVHAKNVHIDLSPHEHDDVYEGNHGPSGARLTDVFVRPGDQVLGNGGSK